MADALLQLCVRTPRSVVLDAAVRSLRVPTDTGQVGLRPRSEPAALAVEPGLVLASGPNGLRFVATAGGLLRCDGRVAVLLTPLAAVAASARSVREALAAAQRGAAADIELRRVLQRLQTGLLEQLRRTGRGGAP